MLFLFTVTEWGHIIYSEETEANTPLQKTADGKRAKIIGFPSSRTLHFLIFMLHNIPQSASTPLDNLHSRTCCRLNYKVVNWGDRHQWFIYTFYSRCILTLIRSFCMRNMKEASTKWSKYDILMRLFDTKATLCLRSCCMFKLKIGGNNILELNATKRFQIHVPQYVLALIYDYSLYRSWPVRELKRKKNELIKWVL